MKTKHFSFEKYVPIYKQDGTLELTGSDHHYLGSLLAYLCEGLPSRHLYAETWGTKDTDSRWMAYNRTFRIRGRTNPTFLDVAKQDVRRIDDPYVILAAIYFLLRLPIGVPFTHDPDNFESKLYLPNHLQYRYNNYPQYLTQSFTPLQESIRNCLGSAEHMHLALYNLALCLGSKSMADMHNHGPVASNASEEKIYFESQRLALKYFNYDLTISKTSLDDLLDLLMLFKPRTISRTSHSEISCRLSLYGKERIRKDQELLKSLRPLPGTPGEDEDLSERFIAEAAETLFVIPASAEKSTSSSDRESPATTCSPHSVPFITAVKPPKKTSYLITTNPDPETPETRTPSSAGSQTTLATSVCSSASLAGDPEFFKASEACSDVFVVIEEKTEAEARDTKSLSIWGKCMDLLIPLYAFVDHMCISD